MANKEYKKFAIFTLNGEGLPLARHLQMEGNEVLVGIVEDAGLAGVKDETPKTKKARMSQHEGMLMNKTSAEKLLEKIESFEDKDDWFVIFDFNSLYKLSEQALKAGFTAGLMPTKLDFQLEADRDFAKSFVTKYYPDLQVAEVQEFKQIEEGIEFLKESDEFWALKGNDGDATTVVPSTKMIQFAQEELIEALSKDRETYERKGFIFERQIRDGVEACPQMIWNDGKRVALSVDYEDKSFSWNHGAIKYGCAINIIQGDIPMDSELARWSFPEVTDKLAKKHKGLWYMDANLIIKDGIPYYLEYCSGRMGFDAVFAECDMAGGPTKYFNALANGQNPYERSFGVGTRAFNTNRQKDGCLCEGEPMLFEDETHLWFYSAKMEDGQVVNTVMPEDMCSIDLVSFTESSDDVEYAMIKLMNVLEQFSFNGWYAREDLKSLLPRIDGLEKFITPAVEGGVK